LTTAFVHNYPMRLPPSYTGLVAGYGPPFVALLMADRVCALPIAAGIAIHFAYLILATRRSHFEYHRRIDLEHELRTQRDLFEHRSRIDALTGLGNRREFNERLAECIEHARERRDPAALMLIIADIDHFKCVNDSHGHAVGDQCLVAFANKLKGAFHGPDELTFRLGGEEFGVLMDNYDARQAKERADAFRAELAAEAFAIDGCEVPVTVSIGVGEFKPDRYADADALYRAVDGALYGAKRDGRNRVAEAELSDRNGAGDVSAPADPAMN